MLLEGPVRRGSSDDGHCAIHRGRRIMGKIKGDEPT
jgi:hypothetical protein